MDRARIALAFIVLLSAVCAVQSKDAEKWTDFQSWADLRSDMTESQVINLLGQPKETTKRPNLKDRLSLPRKNLNRPRKQRKHKKTKEKKSSDFS